MGRLLKLATSANGVPIQIMSRLMLKDSITAYKTLAGDVTLSCISRKNSTPSLRNFPLPLGKPKSVGESLKKFVLDSVAHTGPATVAEYDRMSIHNVSFHSSSYERQTKTDCRGIRLADGTYAKIDHIIEVAGGELTSELFISSHVYYVSSLQGTLHIKAATKRPQYKLYKVDMTMMPCIFMQLEQRAFFCDLVNRYEWS